MDEELKTLIESTAAETRRHFEVVAESLESKIEMVSEGVISANEGVTRIERRVDDLATDLSNGFDDVRSMIKFSHHELDRRLRTLEELVSNLQTRVERLESSTQ